MYFLKWRSLFLVGYLWTPQVSLAVNIELVSIPGGSFSMGSQYGSSDELPVHTVQIPTFQIGKYEVSQAQWKSVMGYNPSHFKGDHLPVESVSWHTVQSFITRINQLTGKHFRLPSEAEWEYAARAGQSGKYSWGDNDRIATQYAWFDSNSDKKTHTVGGKISNAYGLYDMQGNVWEWTGDFYNPTYKGAPANGQPWLSGERLKRVIRGGSWRYKLYFMRSSLRMWDAAVGYSHNIGFRLAHDH